MLECPICKDWLYIHNVCGKCSRIRNVVSLVGIEKVIECLDEVFLRTDEDKVKNKIAYKLGVSSAKVALKEAQIEENKEEHLPIASNTRSCKEKTTL
jgi:hypothetical protein